LLTSTDGWSSLISASLPALSLRHSPLSYSYSVTYQDPTPSPGWTPVHDVKHHRVSQPQLIFRISFCERRWTNLSAACPKVPRHRSHPLSQVDVA